MLLHDIGICSGGILVAFGQRYTDFGDIQFGRPINVSVEFFFSFFWKVNIDISYHYFPFLVDQRNLQLLYDKLIED